MLGSGCVSGAVSKRTCSVWGALCALFAAKLRGAWCKWQRTVEVQVVCLVSVVWALCLSLGSEHDFCVASCVARNAWGLWLGAWCMVFGA